MPDLGSVANSWQVRRPNRGGLQRVSSRQTGGLLPTPATVARLGTLAAFSGPIPASATAHVFAIPSTIAVTNTIIIAGWTNTAGVAITVSDSQGNTWTRRTPPPGITIFLFECQVAHALTATDAITVTPSGALNWSLIGAWYSQCFFDQIQTVTTWTGTAATAGSITTRAGGGPVLGIYGGFYTSVGAVAPVLTGWAGGYTLETGASTVTATTADGIGWISKNGAGGVVETPSALFNISLDVKQGAAVAYSLLPVVVIAVDSSGGLATAGGGAVTSNGILFPVPDDAIMAPMMAV